MKEIGSKSTIISTCLVTVYMLVRGASRVGLQQRRDAYERFGGDSSSGQRVRRMGSGVDRCDDRLLHVILKVLAGRAEVS